MGKNKRYEKPDKSFSLVSCGPEFVKLDKRMRLGSVRKIQCSAHLSLALNPLWLGLRPDAPSPFNTFAHIHGNKRMITRRAGLTPSRSGQNAC